MDSRRVCCRSIARALQEQCTQGCECAPADLAGANGHVGCAGVGGAAQLAARRAQLTARLARHQGGNLLQHSAGQVQQRRCGTCNAAGLRAPGRKRRSISTCNSVQAASAQRRAAGVRCLMAGCASCTGLQKESLAAAHESTVGTQVLYQQARADTASTPGFAHNAPVLYVT